MPAQSVQPDPHLSVAIPTYNRPVELAECLSGIVPQAKPLGIRIYISDNASPPEVQAVVDRFRAEYEHIFYHRNETNLGLDGNVRTVMAMAEGDYVWLFSDDDVMVEGALAVMLPLCHLRKYDLIITESETRDRNLTKNAKSYRVVGVSRPVEFADAVSLFEQYGYSCYSYISCLVIKLDSWRKVDATKYSMFTWFEHLCVLAEMMIGGMALVLPDCLVMARGENASWAANRWLVWGYHFPHALLALPAVYSQPTRRKAVMDMVNPALSNPARFIMTGRACGAITWQNKKALAEIYHRLGFTSWILLIWLVLFVPVPIMYWAKRLFGITKQV